MIKTFIDLCAGIGSFHYVLSRKYNLKCVFASEIDELARQTYKANFKIDFTFNKDMLRIIDIKNQIPDHDVLCAGFPCQPFSVAGSQKGFDDKRSLFPHIYSIIKIKKPKVFILENVKNLLSIDSGKCFKFIKESLESINYDFHYKILKASDYGLPQLRPRVFMVGFNKKIDFKFPKPIKLETTMSDILGGKCNRTVGYTICTSNWSLTKPDGFRNWSTYLVDNRLYKLHPIDVMRMQGFPLDFKFPIKKNREIIKQLGNSIATNVIDALMREILISYKN